MRLYCTGHQSGGGGTQESTLFSEWGQTLVVTACVHCPEQALPTLCLYPFMKLQALENPTLNKSCENSPCCPGLLLSAPICMSAPAVTAQGPCVAFLICKQNSFFFTALFYHISLEQQRSKEHGGWMRTDRMGSGGLAERTHPPLSQNCLLWDSPAVTKQSSHLILRKNQSPRDSARGSPGTASLPAHAGSSHPNPTVHVGKHLRIKTTVCACTCPKQNKSLVFLTMNSWPHPISNYSNMNTGKEIGRKPLDVSIYSSPLNACLNCTGPLTCKTISINMLRDFSGDVLTTMKQSYQLH